MQLELGVTAILDGPEISAARTLARGTTAGMGHVTTMPNAGVMVDTPGTTAKSTTHAMGKTAVTAPAKWWTASHRSRPGVSATTSILGRCVMQLFALPAAVKIPLRDGLTNAPARTVNNILTRSATVVGYNAFDFVRCKCAHGYRGSSCSEACPVCSCQGHDHCSNLDQMCCDVTYGCYPHYSGQNFYNRCERGMG